MVVVVITIEGRGKEDILKKGITYGLLLLGLLTGDSASLLLALALLQEGLGDENLLLGGDSAVKVSTVCP